MDEHGGRGDGRGDARRGREEDDEGRFEAAQTPATFPPTDSDGDKEIAQRYQSTLEQLRDTVFQFRQRLHEYENACSDHARRQMTS